MTIEFQHVHFSYSAEMPVLQDVSLQICEGEIVLVAGHNGAGKSTFLKLLNGLLKPASGNVIVAERDTRSASTSELAQCVAVTFQNPSDQIFAPTVWKEVAFGPKNLKRPDVQRQVSDSLSLFHLDHKQDHHPYDLPPAGRKLLTIASAVATGATFLAFDEPTAGLSQSERTVLISAMEVLRQQNRTLIVVSHDLGFFLPLCSQMMILSRGRLLFFGDTRELSGRERILRSAGLRFPATLRLKKLLGLPLL